MKLFSSLSSWPRWALALLATLLLSLLLGLGVLSEYRGQLPSQAGRTALALQFEADPTPWLDRPHDASDVERLLAERRLAAVGVDERRLLLTTRDGQRLSIDRLPAAGGTDALLARLQTASAEQGFAMTRVRVDPRSTAQRWSAAVSATLERVGGVLMLLLLAGIGYVVVKQAGGLGGNKTELAERSDADFDDVIGAQEAKAALQQVTAFMREPQKYLSLGAKPPRGVLLEGPPGTGKTLLARALAGEVGAKFIAVDGSHFSSMFYGAGIAKVKELFATARKHAPCIVFIDEFDGIGKRSSGAKVAGGTSEENRIINKLLVEMDGFSPGDNVVVIAATNHVGNVDDALKRPGRFDLVARVTLPTLTDRAALFSLCLAKVKTDGSVDADALARASAGLSQAEITNIVNRAAVLAAEAGEEFVSAVQVHRALEAFQLGGEVSSLKQAFTQTHRERIAIHEGGHALVAHVMGAGRVERVSIEPRGQALGVTFVTRADEVPLYGEQELQARIGMLLAGREAELMVYGNTTSGASDDLKRASELAVEMVSAMGFSSEFGLLNLQGVPEGLIGPHIQERALAEAQQFLARAQQVCRDVLNRHRSVLDGLAQALLEDETVSGERLASLLAATEAQALAHGPQLRAACEALPAPAQS